MIIKDFSPIPIDEKITNIVHESVDIYMDKICNRILPFQLEASMQLNLARIITNKLDSLSSNHGDFFQVLLEDRMVLGGNNDYIDISISYNNAGIIRKYLIELKLIHSYQGGPNSANILSYVDINELEQLKGIYPEVEKCFFIFMTDEHSFTVPSRRGTRAIIPMYDHYTICRHHLYQGDCPAAIRLLTSKGYPGGLLFSNNYYIEYNDATNNLDNSHIYYFVLDI